MKHFGPFLTALTLSCAVAAHADQVFNDDLIVTDDACFGSTCADGEPFPIYFQVKVKSTTPTLIFEDSTAGLHDWRLQANSSNTNSFAIRNQDTLATPFSIAGGAPSSSLFLADSGRVGLGTVIPEARLHVRNPGYANLFLDSVSPYGRWDLNVGGSGLFFTDRSSNAHSVIFRNGAPAYSAYIAADGDVGLGTDAPEGKLHTKGDGVQIAYFESGDGGPVQVRFRTNSQNRRFLAVNNADQVQSQVIFLNKQIRFAGPTDSGANLYAIIGPAGIVTQGPVCDPGPCDATFDREAFTVPSIEDHAAFMWENQHLWGVGPTSADEPFNLTQKAGGMLHELEVAHIYIEELNAQLAAERSRNDSQADLIADLVARQTRLERVMSAQESSAQ